MADRRAKKRRTLKRKGALRKTNTVKSKANQPKSRTLYYRRAEWSGSDKSTLEKLLKKAHEELETVGDRTFSTSTGEIKGSKYLYGDGIFIRISAYKPDELASVIDKDKNQKNSKVSTSSAPEGNDFLDSDIFLLVKDNHIILCSNKTRENVALIYIAKVLKKIGHGETAAQLTLEKVSNINKLKIINSEGIKKILLDASLYDASIEDINKSSPASWLGKFANEMKSTFGKDKTLADIESNENLNISLCLSFDGKEARLKKHKKDKGFGDSGKRRLQETAKQILNDESADGFKIVTNSGKIITHDEIKVNEKVKIKPDGKTLDAEDVKEKLLEYYETLNERGILEQ